MIKLVKPSAKYKKSYLIALRELKTGEEYPEVVDWDVKNFYQHLKEVRNAEKGMTKGVPRSEFWLVDDSQYIGMIQIRHRPAGPGVKSHIYYDIRPSKQGRGYGNKILELGLRKLKSLALKQVIVACRENNVASKKIIEHHGGLLNKKVSTLDGVILKYIINAR